MKSKIISISIVNSGKGFLIFIHRNIGNCTMYRALPASPSGKRIVQAMIKLTEKYK